MVKDNLIWAIARIDREKMGKIPELLIKHGFDNVVVKIPCVKVLRKKFKNKEFFDDVPLLFDYGFFGVPEEFARSRELMQELKERVTPILGWLFLNPREVLYKRRLLKMRFAEEHPDIDDDERTEDKFAEYYLRHIIKVKTVEISEINRLMKVCDCFSIFSADDLDRVGIGDTITLHGYPFDNLEAEVIALNQSKREAKVNILSNDLCQEVKVSYDNLFYSIYSDLDDSLSKISLDSFYETKSNDYED